MSSGDTTRSSVGRDRGARARGPYAVWIIRHADGGNEGTEFARARIDPLGSILVHALPDRVRVEVFENGEDLIALGEDLARTATTPMARLRMDGLRIAREDVWPITGDLGSVVVLAGGEAGKLESWSTTSDHSSWSWSLRLDGSA
jgi:hypothetical protein